MCYNLPVHPAKGRSAAAHEREKTMQIQHSPVKEYAAAQMADAGLAEPRREIKFLTRVGVALLLLLPMAAHAQTVEPEYPPLVVAAEENDLEEVRRLLDSGTDVNENYRGYTALHQAAIESAISGSVALMELLLDRGAKVNAQDADGATPLMYALALNILAADLDGVNLLLNHGANPNITARSQTETQISGLTALHLVAAVNSTETCSYTIINDVSTTCTFMSATLGEDVFASGRQVAKALVSHGANVNARDSAGKTPLDYAREFGPPEYAAFFASLMSAPISGDAGVIAQIRAEIDALRVEVAALRALIATNCGAQPCQGTSAQQERLQGLENQIARKVRQAAVLEATASSGGGGGGSGLALGLGAAALLGIAVYALSPAGDAEAFSLRPLASYEYRDGAEALRYGMRLDYRRDSWGLWWSADDSRLGWGGEWRNDLLRAHAEVWDVGGAQDVSTGLGTEWKLAGWSVHPSWRMRGSAGSEGVWTWNSGADLTAEWSGHGWMVRPSVRALDLENPAGALFRLRIAREF